MNVEIVRESIQVCKKLATGEKAGRRDAVEESVKGQTRLVFEKGMGMWTLKSPSSASC